MKRKPHSQKENNNTKTTEKDLKLTLTKSDKVRLRDVNHQENAKTRELLHVFVYN